MPVIWIVPFCAPHWLQFTVARGWIVLHDIHVTVTWIRILRHYRTLVVIRPFWVTAGSRPPVGCRFSLGRIPTDLRSLTAGRIHYSLPLALPHTFARYGPWVAGSTPRTFPRFPVPQ